MRLGLSESRIRSRNRQTASPGSLASISGHAVGIVTRMWFDSSQPRDKVLVWRSRRSRRADQPDPRSGRGPVDPMCWRTSVRSGDS